MEELDLKIYLRVLLKNWRYIVGFVALTLIISSVTNFGFKKAPVPTYVADGSINVTGVVLMDKTTPTILLENQKVQSLFNRAERKLNINKSEYTVNIDTATPNVVKLTGSTLKAEGLDKYINEVLAGWKEEYLKKNVTRIDEILNALDQEEWKGIYDENKQLSATKIQDKLNEVIAEQTNLKAKLALFEGNFEKNKYNIDLNTYMIQQTKARLNDVDALKREALIKKIVDLETNSDENAFNKKFYMNEIETSKIRIESNTNLIAKLHELNDFAIIQTKTISKLAKNSMSKAFDIRYRSVIISTLLVLVLMCCFVIAKEYYVADRRKETK